MASICLLLVEGIKEEWHLGVSISFLLLSLFQGTHLEIFGQLTLVMVLERHQQAGRQRQCC
ncbi:hypothetical protein E2562_007469 [Oryza meyeriana var. granulata]|uniref:Uncharacterized protein n=1 Tax=Oryza meyeriana var. granulata TaxID=110450 RepID=A0A6G1F4X6_9ORYZ|nr:hypothetical protein E2562_007469 [Oryza meyeriana var. granulata]